MINTIHPAPFVLIVLINTILTILEIGEIEIEIEVE
jgi:hypothetical protein